MSKEKTRLARWLRGLATTMRRYVRERRSMTELSRLDPRLLRDLGLSEFDVSAMERGNYGTTRENNSRPAYVAPKAEVTTLTPRAKAPANDVAGKAA
ncbi:MAG: hypothetical protein ACI9W2_000240 [Gammaproteobacteria bacterium]|jgi:uncharacterized protein YjiS (DUF1127 family)